MEEEIFVHTNPHGKKRLSTKGRIHSDGVKYIRADVVEEKLNQVKNLNLFGVSKQSELLIAFREWINEDEEMHLYIPEKHIDRFIEGNL